MVAPAVLTLADLRIAHREADRFCLEVQNFLDQAGIPAINELRNVGFHLLRAIDDDGHIVNQPELDKAVAHAKRACYEASEAGILTALDNINKFKNDYATVVIGSTIANYGEILKSAADALKLIETGRAADDDKTSDFDVRMSVFRTLRLQCEKLDIGREEMNKLIDNSQLAARRFYIQITIAATALAATLLFGGSALISSLRDKSAIKTEIVATTRTSTSSPSKP